MGEILLVPPQQAVGQLPGDLWGNLYFLYDLPWGGGDSRGQTLGNFLVAWHYGNLPTLLGEVFCPRWDKRTLPFMSRDCVVIPWSLGVEALILWFLETAHGKDGCGPSKSLRFLWALTSLRIVFL